MREDGGAAAHRQRGRLRPDGRREPGYPARPSRGLGDEHDRPGEPAVAGGAGRRSPRLGRVSGSASTSTSRGGGPCRRRRPWPRSSMATAASGAISAALQERARPDEVRRECEAQIEAFARRFGRAPTHLDSHHHAHRLPRVMDAVVDVVLAARLPLRSQDPGFRDGLRRRGIVTTDSFVGDAQAEPYWTTERLLDELASLPLGVTELMCHPGVFDESARLQPLRAPARGRAGGAVRRGGAGDRGAPRHPALPLRRARRGRMRSAAPETPLIELRGVTKVYREGDAERAVLRGVDATIRRGELCALDRAERLRQVHAPQPDRRDRRADRGRDRRRRAPTRAGDRGGAHAVPPASRRLRLPVLQPDPDAHGGGEPPPAARAERPAARCRARAGRRPPRRGRAGRPGARRFPSISRAASSSGWRWRGRWSTSRSWCWPTSRRGTSTSTRAGRCWSCSIASPGRRVARW